MPSYLIGFDEAGYGPTIGPLVITAVVFRTPNDKVNLWESLKNTVSIKPREKNQITVCDSKKIYTPARGLNRLETSLLPFVLLNNYSEINNLTISKLIEITTASAIKNISTLPWYSLADKVTLPLSGDKNLILRLFDSLKRSSFNNGIIFMGAYSYIIDADKFNTMVSLKNKSELLFDITSKLLKKIFGLYFSGSENIYIYAGKHGGKTYYLSALTKAFPEYSIQSLRETHACSEYAITHKEPKKCLISFLKNGEDKHFTIALASMYCKYQRELCMKMFNGFWNKHLPALKPTAGYYTDGRRFLSDIAPMAKKIRINPKTFTRIR